MSSWLFFVLCVDEMLAHCLLIALGVCVFVCVEQPPAAGGQRGQSDEFLWGCSLCFRPVPFSSRCTASQRHPNWPICSARPWRMGPVWDLNTRGNTHTHTTSLAFPTYPCCLEMICGLSILCWQWPNVLVQDHQLAERPSAIVLEGFSQMFHWLRWIGIIPLHLSLLFILLSVFSTHTPPTWPSSMLCPAHFHLPTGD